MTSPKNWTAETLDAAVAEVISAGIFDEPMLQARPAWQIAGAILIADCQVAASRYWLIAGTDSPTDVIPAHVAGTPREAARHFSLKWQLAAEQLRAGDSVAPQQITPDDLSGRVGHLVKCAESLMELVEHDSVWVD
jgi:hypothetical protein